LAAGNPKELFLENLGTIDEIVTFVANRHRLTQDEREELAAGVRLKLVDDDYAVLRKFAGRSSLKTYLAAVITRYLLDLRNERLGRWRPSVEARRRGPVAVLLERMMSRDGLTFEEAMESLRTNHGVRDSRQALEAMCPLTVRPPRRFVGEEHLDAATTADPESAAIARLDRDAVKDEVETALRGVLSRRNPQERLILKLRFEDGFRIVKIATLLGLDQKSLYRQLDRIVAELRTALEAAGVDRARVTAFLDENPEKSPALSVSVMRGGERRAAAGHSEDHV
jgi:RNA polymerase sigma factor for flagellar operon FliA